MELRLKHAATLMLCEFDKVARCFSPRPFVACAGTEELRLKHAATLMLCPVFSTESRCSLANMASSLIGSTIRPVSLWFAESGVSLCESGVLCFLVGVLNCNDYCHL